MSEQPGLLEALRKAVDALDSCGVECALVGAIAVGARTEPRFTGDVDIAVAVTRDEQAESVVRSLIRSGYELRELFQHEVTEEIVTVRLIHPDSPDVMIDLLFQTSGIEPEVVARAEVVQVFPEFAVRVARLGDLIAMKLLSRSDDRPLDQGDLVRLLQAATDEDIALAEEAIQLVQERGRADDRDLSSELDDLRRKFRPGAGSTPL